MTLKETSPVWAIQIVVDRAVLKADEHTRWKCSVKPRFRNAHLTPSCIAPSNINPTDRASSLGPRSTCLCNLFINSIDITMVALDIVHASNAQLRELGPGLVALFGTCPAPDDSLPTWLTEHFYSRSYVWNRGIYCQSLCEEHHLPARVYRGPQCLSGRAHHQRMQDAELGQPCGVPERRCVRAARGGSYMRGDREEGDKAQSRCADSGKSEFEGSRWSVSECLLSPVSSYPLR
jgi:hypothetical protein